MQQATGLVYRVSIPRYLMGRALGPVWPWLLYGPLSSISLQRRPLPQPPQGDWLELGTRLCGICGSDVALLRGKSSPALSPFHSFPAVLGHEVLADVAGPVGDALAGRRVVVDPVISCQMRGIEPCPACASGQSQQCRRRGERDGLGPGTLVGYHAQLPGGFGDRLFAHRSQLYAVPDAVPDERAVLAEPYAIALHGVLRSPPPAGAKLLVLGGGTIGLLTVAALARHAQAEIHLVARHPHQRRLGLELGAHRAYGPPGASVAVQAAVAAQLLRPLMGPPVFSDGFDYVYDCIGSEDSLRDSLRVTRHGGTLVLLGTAGSVNVDWSFVWANELDLIGCFGYGRETDGRHTFQWALDDFAAHDGAAFERLITDRYRLQDYREAMRRQLVAGPNRPLKAVFDFRAGSPAGAGNR